MTTTRHAIVCAVLILAFGVCGMLPVARQSATIDEPIGALAGYVHVTEGNFQLDVDNPPLWKYWATLPNLFAGLKPAALQAGQTSSGSAGVRDDFRLATRRLYQTPGNDGEAFVNRSRAMMLLLGMLLAFAVARWAWQLAGATAGVIACALFCFDPNFLAHAPLVKADVAVPLLSFSGAWAAWAVGRRVTALNVIALAAVCGAAVTVKYNGIIIALTSALLVFGRAVLLGDWPVFSASMATRGKRLIVAGGIVAVVCIGSYVLIWACYGFRYAPVREGTHDALSVAAEVRALQSMKLKMRDGIEPTSAPIDGEPSPTLARAALWLDRRRLLPKAWLFGLVSIYASSTTIVRPSYLMGEISLTGWWSYFPIVVACKTPLATLAAIALSVVALLHRRRFNSSTFQSSDSRWTILCLALPPTLYAAATLLSTTNAGVRYILPIYPAIYVGIGIIVARALRDRPRLWRIVTPMLGIGLIVESLLACPRYISFFNIIARPHSFYLLGDSNFDWGQDLKDVAKWQRAHSDVLLYLAYWGPTDPKFYGIRYTPLPGGFAPDDALSIEAFTVQSPPGVIMVSASILQGTHFPDSVRSFYTTLRRREPDRVVGDTIYLYTWPLDSAPRASP